MGVVEEGPGEVHDSGASCPLRSPARSPAPAADPGPPGPAAIVTSRERPPPASAGACGPRGSTACHRPQLLPGYLERGAGVTPPRRPVTLGAGLPRGPPPSWSPGVLPGRAPGIPRGEAGGSALLVPWRGKVSFYAPTSPWNMEIQLLPDRQLVLTPGLCTLPLVAGALEKAPQVCDFCFVCLQGSSLQGSPHPRTLAPVHPPSYAVGGEATMRDGVEVGVPVQQTGLSPGRPLNTPECWRVWKRPGPGL